MPISFAEAKNKAEAIIKRLHFQSALHSAIGERASEASWAALRLQSDPETLIQEAESSSRAYHDLKNGIAMLQRNDEEIPRQAIEWNVQYLRGEKRPPQIERGNRQVRRPKERNKQIVIAYAVQVLVNSGLNPFRSHGKVGPKESACDAVAKALQRLEIKPQSYRRVEAIFSENQKLAEDMALRISLPKN